MSLTTVSAWVKSKQFCGYNQQNCILTENKVRNESKHLPTLCMAGARWKWKDAKQKATSNIS